jgi:hypothetical protein
MKKVVAMKNLARYTENLAGYRKGAAAQIDMM